MAELLKWHEDEPAAFDPGTPAGLSPKAAAIPPRAIWARIESWTGYRWAPRSFEAIVCGPGEWLAPVEPVSSLSVEIWYSEHWEISELRQGPLGIELGCGTFRITGQAGSGELAPADVLEAYKRLAEYIAAMSDRPGMDSVSYGVGGELDYSWRRGRSAMARAMQDSGAADLLRPYRRVK